MTYRIRRHGTLPRRGNPNTWLNGPPRPTWLAVFLTGRANPPGEPGDPGGRSGLGKGVRPALILLLAGLGWGGTGALAGPPPNILLIVSEDNGPELACYGDPYAQTPTLDELADRVVRFKNAPFLLTINYPDAHLPMHRQAHGLPEVPLSWDQVRTLPWLGATSQRLRTETANYYNCLRRLDDGIAMLMEELDRLGIADDTLVLYMGDHGAQFSRGKTSVYEAGLRIPMIVRWPGHAVPGLAPTELVSTLDIMPTFLTAADVAIPSQLTGRPLQPLLEGKDPAWREYIYGISTGGAPSIGYLQYSIRDARYKLISNPLKDPAMPPNLVALHNRSAQAYLDGGGHFAAGSRPEEVAATPAHVQEAYARFLNPPRYELYDLAVDPYEWTNLAERVAHADTRQRLIDSLDAWQRSEAIQDPLVVLSNLVLYAQSQENAIGTDYREDHSFRWSYLDAFPAWRRNTYPRLYPPDPPPPPAHSTHLFPLGVDR